MELGGKAQLMVIFDIPENQKAKRQQLRGVLKKWQFNHVQKSVWVTNKDYKKELELLIKELDDGEHVELYECLRRFPQ